MADNGSSSPEFETDENRSSFLIRLPVQERAVVAPAPAPVTAKVGTKLGLSRDQVEILHYCSEIVAFVDLLEAAGRTNRTKFRHQVLNPILDAGLIEMTIPDKPRSSNQRYRLTAAGKQWLTQPK